MSGRGRGESQPTLHDYSARSEGKGSGKGKGKVRDRPQQRALKGWRVSSLMCKVLATHTSSHCKTA